MERLEAKEANWKALELKLKENTANAAEKINLNVRGKTFCIAKSHLLSVEGSYFHVMLASSQWKPDSDGAYFIDHNPKHFNRVLDYLRTGDDGLCPDQIKTLRKTLDYLQIVPAPPPVVWDPQMCGSDLLLSRKNRVVSNNGQSGSVCSLIACDRYSVRISAVGHAAMVGFAPDAGFDPGFSYMYSRCGWYMYLNNGANYSQEGVHNKSYGLEGLRLAAL